jgi:hypothetical protein
MYLEDDWRLYDTPVMVPNLENALRLMGGIGIGPDVAINMSTSSGALLGTTALRAGIVGAIALMKQSHISRPGYPKYSSGFCTKAPLDEYTEPIVQVCAVEVGLVTYSLGAFE